MPWTDSDLEQLYLYGRLLLPQLPTGDNDPMPQLSKSVQLTHLRIAVTSDEAITLGPRQRRARASRCRARGKGRRPSPSWTSSRR